MPQNKPCASNSKTREEKRIPFLEGLRGAAILPLVLYQSYIRWPQLTRYGGAFSEVPILKDGFMGVHLFFIISGFVILMTLEKCRGLKEFIGRRWIRLFPAMLIASLLIFYTSPFFHEAFIRPPVMRDLLPGLTFIESGYWGKILGSPQGQLAETFWSLYIGVKFYLLFGILFFMFGSNIAILGLLCVFSFDVLFHSPVHGWYPKYDMGWFAAGALFYNYYKSSKIKWLLAGLLTVFACALALRRPDAVLMGTLLGLFFAWALISNRLRTFLSSRFFLFLGFVSYPLYLIHGTMLPSLIVKMGLRAPQAPDVVLPLLPIVVVCGVAWLIAAYGEPLVRRSILFCVDYCGRWAPRKTSRT